MGITTTRVAMGVAGALAAAALGVGTAAVGSGPPPAAQVDLDPTCVLGLTAGDVPEGAEPWEAGLQARSDALNRQHGLGRYAAGGECADIPDWYRALVLRGDAMNRAHGLGPYARGER